MTPRFTSRTRGFSVIVVLGALVFVMLVGVALVQAFRLGHTQERIALRARQAELLVAAGLERAATRLAADPQYAGETWELAPGDLQGPAGALVEIRVEQETAEAQRRLRIEASYPADSPQQVRRSIEINLVESSAGDAS